MAEGNNNNNNNNAADMKIIAPLETLPSVELKMENGFHMTKNNDSPVMQISYGKSNLIYPNKFCYNKLYLFLLILILLFEN